MAEESLKVAVRVRPFNKREKKASAKLCVAMTGPTTIITDPESGEEKRFAYDFSYWSFDGYHEAEDGYNTGDSPKYHDQKVVYNDLGVGVLKNAWEGYNASLFAYGQTGSGKSYSVVGYGTNKGIVPLVCEDIFKTSENITDKTIEVQFSMLEIYSEVVRDLLNPSGNRKQGLRIRQNPKTGFYPVGLKKELVSNYKQIEDLTDEGTSNRTIASTNMNATSSRAHTIVTVTLIQKYKNEAGKELAKTSSINLVDLAGSERADATGATGDRLKEGAAINMSLTALGNVISALADQSNGKNTKVPYRDSALTKLLMNALGGNSKTIMIAAISPADINFDESVSTLRYADRAKQIKTKAVVNEDPTEKLIRDLKEENERLKALVAGGKFDPSMLEDGQKTDNSELNEEMEAMRKQIEENEKEEAELRMEYEEKLAAALANKSTGNKDRAILLEKVKTTPHFANLNMDPSLSKTVFILLEGEGEKTIGVPTKADICLHGISIKDPHGKISINGGKYMIECFEDAKILKNGRKISSLIELNHLDRIVFGSTQYYLFIDPSKASSKDPNYTFETAQDEIGKASGVIGEGNLSQEQLLSQAELVELVPEIEEANMISIALDKKVKYTAHPVSAALRGEYDDKVKLLVSVKNFQLGLKWLWTKEKFLDRKADMSEYFLDIKEDGKIDQKKFLNYDPFYESPDTPTQIGTCNIPLMSIGHMIPLKDDFTILNMKSKYAGEINVEVIPCEDNGKPITNQIIRNPVQELKNTDFNFLIRINACKNLKETFEDCFCQFKVMGDKEIFKTQVVKKANQDFRFSKQFTYKVTPSFMRFLLNKQLLVQIWGEQKHPSPNNEECQMTTKEYFEKEKQNAESNLAGKMREKSTDPEVQMLKEKIKFLEIKAKKDEATINELRKLLEASKFKEVDEEEMNTVLSRNGFASRMDDNNKKNVMRENSSRSSTTCSLL